MGKMWNEITIEDIELILDEMIQEIFEKYNLDEMPSREKRKKIYNYLVTKKKYNYEYFNSILKNYNQHDIEKVNPKDSREEFIEPLLYDSGICNGFSKLYKLLLEEVGIYSLCVNCMIKYNNQFVGHQLNLVYDDELKTFSFDDVTYGIIKQTKNEYFDYDNPEQKEMQGCVPTHGNIRWVIQDDNLINWYAKRKKALAVPNSINIIYRELHDLAAFEKNGIYIKSTQTAIERKKVM